GVGVQAVEGLQVEALLDGLQDGQGVVPGVVHETLLGVGGDDDGGDAGAVAPGAVAEVGRADVVPEAAVLVVGDDDGGVGPGVAVLDGVDDVGDVLLALQQVGVTGVLVIGADRLDEADRGQTAVGQVGEERRLVLQVGVGVEQAVGLGVRRAVGVERGVVGVVGEGLVVELVAAPEGVRLGGAKEGVIPAAGVPPPADPRVVQAVADGRGVGRVGRAV